MTLSLYVDIALAALLVATVFYAARLNKRLGMLRRDRGELTALISQFNAATAAAEAAMKGLRASADNSGRALQEAVENARGTLTDLKLLVDRGEQAADRLDAAISAGRSLERSGAEPAGFSPGVAVASASAAASGRAALLKAIERME